MQCDSVLGMGSLIQDFGSSLENVDSISSNKKGIIYGVVGRDNRNFDVSLPGLISPPYYLTASFGAGSLDFSGALCKH